jgi:hypothetical protein
VLEVIVQAHELGVKTRLPLNLNIIKVLSPHLRTAGAPPEHHKCTVVANFLSSTLVSTLIGTTITPSRMISVILINSLSSLYTPHRVTWVPISTLTNGMHCPRHVFWQCQHEMLQQLWQHWLEWISISAFPHHCCGIGHAPSCPRSPIHKADSCTLSTVLFS